MKTVALDAPGMYADHHVTEVRRLLLAVSGVKEIFASSAFRVVEVSFDTKKTNETAIREALDATGYLKEIPMMAETGAAADNRAFPRHSKVVPQVGAAVAFGQEIPSVSLPVFSCPGLGVIRTEE